MSETNLDRVTQDAQRKSGEAWRVAADRVGSDRVTLQKKAEEAQNEAEILSQKSTLKADEASVLRRDSATLESAEAAMAAKADTAAKPPGISDRLRAGMDSMKERISSAFGGAKTSVEETGDRASEKYNQTMASMKESAAEGMATTATKSADAAERIKDSAQKSHEKAQIAKDKFETSRAERGSEVDEREIVRERDVDLRGSDLDQGRITTTTEKTRFSPSDRSSGSTKDYLKEKAAGTAENVAESVGDRARSTEESMGESRRDAQLAQGKVPERL